MLSADTCTESKVYIFRATLVGVRGVSRKLAVRADGTLEDLHGLLQIAYDWDDDHLYAFWPSGKFWDREPGAGLVDQASAAIPVIGVPGSGLIGWASRPVRSSLTCSTSVTSGGYV